MELHVGDNYGTRALLIGPSYTGSRESVVGHATITQLLLWSPSPLFLGSCDPPPTGTCKYCAGVLGHCRWPGIQMQVQMYLRGKRTAPENGCVGKIRPGSFAQSRQSTATEPLAHIHTQTTRRYPSIATLSPVFPDHPCTISYSYPVRNLLRPWPIIEAWLAALVERPILRMFFSSQFVVTLPSINPVYKCS